MGACTSIKDIKSVVENFHLLTEKQFIYYIDMKICSSFEKGERAINYSKINDPINMKYNDTILHYAVFHNKSEISKFLIEKGANPFLQNKRNRSPYDLAKSKNYDNLVILFDSKKMSIKLE